MWRVLSSAHLLKSVFDYNAMISIADGSIWKPYWRRGVYFLV